MARKGNWYAVSQVSDADFAVDSWRLLAECSEIFFSVTQFMERRALSDVSCSDL